MQVLVVDELGKRTSNLLAKPIDIVGDDKEAKPVKKTKKVKKGEKGEKGEKKKQWTREEILSTFLPADRQLKGRRSTAKQPASTTPKRDKKKHFPAAVVKKEEPTPAPTAPIDTAPVVASSSTLDEGKESDAKKRWVYE